jgi:hypothetical protein
MFLKVFLPFAFKKLYYYHVSVIICCVNLMALCLPPAQMGIASVVHLYVFPAKPYELLVNQTPGNISVLGDYASADPIDPYEIKESNRPSKMKLPQFEPDERSATNIKESVKDFVIGSGEYVSCRHLLRYLTMKLSVFFFNHVSCLVMNYETCG